MTNSRAVITFLLLTLTVSLTAQVAPTTGEKVLEVKESYEGEYLQRVKKTLIKATVENFKELVTKKLIKYGFTDITITEVGEVPSPEGWATKLGKISSNKSVGRGMLQEAKTYSQMEAAVDKMYQPEDTDGVDWKFQVNFTDNTSKQPFKLRVSGLRVPKYIIKESDLVKDLSSLQN